MEKVGIITHYYKSLNYGGNLQAWALCRVLRQMGYDAEQISLQRDISLKTRCSKILNKVLTGMHFNLFRNIKIREDALLRFNKDAIPHTKRVTERTIYNLKNDFDILITGSDQVWHPWAVCDAYLLRFADGDNTYKMSYAASISTDYLPDAVQKRYQAALTDFSAISVREEQAVPLIKSIVSQKVEWVLDPVFLLSKQEWDNCSTNRFVGEQYILCFFLGEDMKHRFVAEQYAASRNLKMYTLPHLSGKVRKCDMEFGDVALYDIDPQDFLALIKNADYVFTDSFHCAAFSIIFEREFFVFDRGGMSSRIYSLMRLFDCSCRFCDTEEKVTLDYLQSLSPMNYSAGYEAFGKMKAASLAFLSKNLENAKKNTR